MRTCYPLNAEVVLTHTAAHPMESHVDALGTLNLDGVGSKTYRALVVAQQKCGRLRMTESRKNCARTFSMLGTYKHSGVLCLRSRSHDHIDDGAD